MCNLEFIRDICEICSSDKRANGQICVVEDVADLWAMERSGVFQGRYHVLGGTLSALDSIGPDELRIPKLVTRVTTENVTEIILALNATVDGQTTAHYIADLLEDQVTLTSLAQGVPIGGELDYLDDGTMVVCEGASSMIGKEISTVVTRVLQSSAGRMIFCKPVHTPRKGE